MKRGNHSSSLPALGTNVIQIHVLHISFPLLSLRPLESPHQGFAVGIIPCIGMLFDLVGNQGVVECTGRG